MHRLKLTPHNHQQLIKQAIAVLQKGGLVIYPTETCYGIGTDATNQAAIDRLLQYKTKRNDKPISVAVANKAMASRYVHVNAVANNMYTHFLPGPITVISKSKHILAKGVESSMGTQGIRIPDYPFVLELLKKYKKPITATSANASYKKTSYTIADILNNLSKKQQGLVDFIIDVGRLPKRKPSTIVDTTLDSVHIIREGSITLQNQKKVITHSLKDTEALVENIFNEVQPYIGKKAVVFLLQGDLGAGKTHFTKYLAKKLSIKEIVSSPTFIICQEYKGRVGRKAITLQHIDTYRLYDASEIDALRPQELFTAPNVVVIEWANKVHTYIEPYLNNAIVIKMHISGSGPTTRTFEYEITK